MTRTALFVALALSLSVVALLSSAARSATRPVAGQPVAHTAGEQVTLTVRPSHGLVHEDGSEVYVEVAVQADRALAEERRVVSMALVLDASGSMRGEKLEKAKEAARRFVQLLGADDELTVLRFSTDASQTPLRAMDEAGKAQTLAFVEGIQAEGGTNIDLALTQGARALADAKGTRRLVLISDGEPTVGDTRTDSLGARAAQAHEDSISVTALGVGNDFHAALMQQLADRGGGFYGYLQSAGRLDEVLSQELAQARTAFARALTVELAPGDGVTLAEVPGREVQWRSGRAVLSLPDLAPGAEARIYVRLTTPRTSESALSLLTTSLKWTRVGDGRQVTASAPMTLAVTDSAGAFDQARSEEVFSAGVRAIGTTKLVAAAAAFERGDRSSAFSLLDNAHALFGMSADALAGDSEVVVRTRQQWQGIHDEDGQKSAGKDLELKGMKSFGMSNTY